MHKGTVPKWGPITDWLSKVHGLCSWTATSTIKQSNANFTVAVLRNYKTMDLFVGCCHYWNVVSFLVETHSLLRPFLWSWCVGPMGLSQATWLDHVTQLPAEELSRCFMSLGSRNLEILRDQHEKKVQEVLWISVNHSLGFIQVDFHLMFAESDCLQNHSFGMLAAFMEQLICGILIKSCARCWQSGEKRLQNRCLGVHQLFGFVKGYLELTWAWKT